MTEVTEAIRNFERSTPRVVADLRSVSFEVKHVRDDLEERYSAADLDEAYQLIMANHVTGDDLKSLVEAGQFNAQTFYFDDVIMFFFPSERYEGVFASFDHEEGFPVTELVNEVSEARGGER